jgi:trans-aconitate methyltransferase
MNTSGASSTSYSTSRSTGSYSTDLPRVRDVGPACDLGCGPGQVARYLHERGVQVCGVDLSPTMVERARGLTPAVEFRQGDMMALDAPDGAWAGVAPDDGVARPAR